MTKSRDTDKDAIIRRLQACLEAKGKSNDANKTLAAQVDFYSQFRGYLSVNDSSRGIQALDDIALAIVDPEDEGPTLREVVMILPATDLMLVGCPPTHSLFSSTTTTATKRRATRSSSSSSPPVKKQRSSKTSSKNRSTYSFELPDDTPNPIKRDIKKMLAEAEDQGKAPFRLAIPWAAQRAWYDPKEYPDLHLQHYRFWVKHRPAFFSCALYAPTDKSGACRKQKSQATQARLKFINANIETFGYYNFLDRIENGSHDSLMWFGGKASTYSAAAKAQSDPSSPAQVDLATLFRRDRARYDRSLARALNPFSIDEDGYGSIVELLEQTSALDPTRKPHLRLSDTALARITLNFFLSACSNAVTNAPYSGTNASLISQNVS